MANNLARPIPSSSEALRTLLFADFTVQWRNRRALIMSLIVPIIFVISWKSLVPVVGGPAVLAICISIGLPAVGLMGYSMTLARDRERGVFQRLRAAPVPTWAIMASRIIVQLAVMAVMTLVTCAFAFEIDKISIPIPNLIAVVIAGVIGGLSFLALGQFVVAFVMSTEAVNSAARLIYFPIAIVGALGEIGLFGQTVQNIVVWSPLGTTKTIIAAAMDFSTWNGHVWLALLVTLAYGLVFAGIGIRNFKWTMQ